MLPTSVDVECVVAPTAALMGAGPSSKRDTPSAGLTSDMLCLCGARMNGLEVDTLVNLTEMGAFSTPLFKALAIDMISARTLVALALRTTSNAQADVCLPVLVSGGSSTRDVKLPVRKFVSGSTMGSIPVKQGASTFKDAAPFHVLEGQTGWGSGGTTVKLRRISSSSANKVWFCLGLFVKV